MAAVNLVTARNGHHAMPANYAHITPYLSSQVRTWECRANYGPFMIEGAASTAAIDRHREVLDPMGMFFDALPLPVVLGHDGSEVGQVVWVRRTPYAIFVRASITNSLLWNDILAQKLRRFSVLAESFREAIRRDCDGVLIHRQWKLAHVAIASDDAVNGECFFWPLADDEVMA